MHTIEQEQAAIDKFLKRLRKLNKDGRLGLNSWSEHTESLLVPTSNFTMYATYVQGSGGSISVDFRIHRCPKADEASIRRAMKQRDSK
jgi:hypothetical protein